MGSIYIKGVLVDGEHTNIIINGSTIAAVSAQAQPPVGATVLHAEGMAAMPAFANMHSHAPMALLRGLADDVPLQQWLNQYIWPAEQRLDDDAIYWGTRLACMEMALSGTTAFNDMYFHLPAMAHAVADSGLQARLGLNLFGEADELDGFEPTPADGVTYSVAPHSIYTVSTSGLRRAAAYCAEHHLPMHIHMAETEREVADCQRQHGCRPYELLQRLGVLDAVGSNLVGAHSLHLSAAEIGLMGRHGITAVHCPNSNLKLGSGHRFAMAELQRAGVNVALGTDGCASSNNLCMLEAAKTAALLQKGWRADPTAATAQQAMQTATVNGFKAMGIKAGRIAPGWQADLVLIDLADPAFTPCHNLLSNYLYAAHSHVVHTTICRGRIVMQGRRVPDHEAILHNARAAAQRLRG